MHAWQLMPEAAAGAARDEGAVVPRLDPPPVALLRLLSMLSRSDMVCSGAGGFAGACAGAGADTGAGAGVGFGAAGCAGFGLAADCDTGGFG